MCLLVLAWMTHPRYRLVVAANRDEFHDRPAAPLGWWSDHPQVLAGRDLRAGGTWMGVTSGGRFGIVTNFRDLEPPPATDSPSRGRLVPDFLSGDAGPGLYVEQLGGTATTYAGFNLLVGDPRSLHYLSNRESAGPRRLQSGIYGLSNHRLDTPWPKLVRTRQRFAGTLESEDLDEDELLDLLNDREPSRAGSVPHTGLPADWERAMSAPFVLHERYGTRCSTVLLADRDGRTTMLERRFDADGRQTGATRLEFVGDEQRE